MGSCTIQAVLPETIKAAKDLNMPFLAVDDPYLSTKKYDINIGRFESKDILPENFEFTFYLKAESPLNNFEIKFLDSTGQNVWWVNNRSYDFPKDWKKIKIKKRHIHFAWGPTNDQSLKRIDRVEFTIASVVGGKGTVWIDDLKFEPLPPEDNSPIKPSVSASSQLNENYSFVFLIDGRPNTEWRSDKAENQTILLDLHKRREFGAIIIDWVKEMYAKAFDVYISKDRKSWEKVYSVVNAKGNKKRKESLAFSV